VGKVGFVVEPQLERRFVDGESRVGDAILDMRCGLDRECPKPLREVGIYDHSARHGDESAIASFGNSVLAR
jgi:hypothetical protein